MWMPITLLGICGSMRRGSLNRALLVAVGETLPEGATLRQWDSLDLPIFSTDLEDPPAVVALKRAIAEADGVVFAVPEYNYSIPGGLKNAIDWISNPPAKSPLRGKPCAIIGAASGMSGTIRAQAHMRQILLYSDSPVLSQPEILVARAYERFDAEGRLIDTVTREWLTKFGAALVRYIERHAPRTS
ncbi:MAG TPA: NAD(P)H-dependent oxidoreductase [Kofleriaceae bacterium]|nr:NAD(P)H-dependent oxidoreductase [Kofleriaceae bacterium]